MAVERCEARRQTIQVVALHEKQPTVLERRMARRVTEPLPQTLTCGESARQPLPRVMKINRRQFASDPECACACAPVEMEGYTFLDVLGRGSYGVVHRATCHKTGGQVALKVINTSTGHDLQSVACREYDFLRQMDHLHIVRAFDLQVLTSNAVLVMELFGGAPLSRAVSRAAAKCFAQGETRVLFRALLSALDHLHGRGVVHRDVKPDNVLVSDDLTDLRLVDFNSACLSRDLTELCASGTELYAAPEVLRGAAPTEANDVWGAGVCLHLMLSGRLPSICGEAIESPMKGEPTELRVSGSRWKNVTESARSVVRRCLALQRTQRPSAASMLEDDWVFDAEGNARDGLDGWVSGAGGKATTELAFEKVQLPNSRSTSDDRQWSKASTVDSRRVGSKPARSGASTSAGFDEFDTEWEFAIAY